MSTPDMVSTQFQPHVQLRSRQRLSSHSSSSTKFQKSLCSSSMLGWPDQASPEIRKNFSQRTRWWDPEQRPESAPVGVVELSETIDATAEYFRIASRSRAKSIATFSAMATSQKPAGTHRCAGTAWPAEVPRHDDSTAKATAASKLVSAQASSAARLQRSMQSLMFELPDSGIKGRLYSASRIEQLAKEHAKFELNPNANLKQEIALRRRLNLRKFATTY